MATPQVLSRKANGVLPALGSQSAHSASDVSKPTKSKTPIEGEKVIIRRLPPGLTEEEFVQIIGGEWKVGSGRVDWFSFKAGKISQDPSKPSRPARAYLHVKKRDELMPLSEAVRTAVWQDAKETWTNASLVGPPMTEFAIYKKVPSGKRRNDGRQGTIDQDQEFMDFLEALANPAAQKNADDETGADEAGKLDGKATSTPLIEYLREKKANKAKDASNAKGGKHARGESQGGKGKGSEESKKKSKDKDKSSDKPKETVKILTKKQATSVAAEAAKVVTSQLGGTSTQEAPKSRRAGIAAAARILERDLGLSPGSAHRRARIEAAKQEAAKKADGDGKGVPAKEDATPASGASATSSAPGAAPTGPKAQTQQSTKGSRKKGAASETGRGKASEKATEGAPTTTKAPMVLLKKKDEGVSAEAAARPSTPTTGSTAAPSGPKAAPAKGAAGQQKKSSAPAAPTPGATRAFVKHANPSQGVTEALLKETMETFGSVTFVEIDRRKGFAYVDFADHDSLVKAMSASPVTVAQANVQVLERKEINAKKAAPSSSTTAAAASSTAAATTSSAQADKAASASASEHKRGGRRRGARGGKEANGKEGSKSADQGSGAAPPATVASSGAG